MIEKIMHITTKKYFIKFYKQILKLLTRVYIGTEGQYPAMEWLEKKPDYKSKSIDKEFESAYGQFLKWRLTEELDELFLLLLDKNLIGTIALTINFEGKEISWIPQKYRKKNYGFIELFTVDPMYQGYGYGLKLLRAAFLRLKSLNRLPLVVTFPNLAAFNYYIRLGGIVLEYYGKFVILDLSNATQTLL